MEQQSARVTNAAKNAAAGIVYQLFLLVFQFTRRTALLRTLGLEYLGIGGVFSNLFSLLALTELGFGAAISVRLYAPAARGNGAETAALALYQVHAVTEGTDAQAEVSVRLEDGDKAVTGRGSDPDTLVASAQAYIIALNKLQTKRNSLNAQAQPAAE